MDEMKLKMSNGFMKGIVTKIIGKAIRKQLGIDIDILVNELVITNADGKFRIHADVDAEATNEEVKKLLKDLV